VKSLTLPDVALE